MPVLKYLVFTIGLLTLSTACTKDAADKLNPAERQAVDTLYTNELKVLRPLLDSICEVRQDSIILRVADSLVRVRMEEIDRIMNRQ